MNGSSASVFNRMLSCFAAGWESGMATTNGSRWIVSMLNDFLLDIEGDRINPTLCGLSSSSSEPLTVVISESSSITSGYNCRYFRTIRGRTSSVAEELKPIIKRPVWPVCVRRADSTAFSACRKIWRASSKKTCPASRSSTFCLVL